MIEEKAPPVYASAPQAGYHQAQGQRSDDLYVSPPAGQQPFQQPGYNSAPGIGPLGPQTGYPPIPTADMSAGAQYQQQLFAMCAQGNHDVTTKYGIGGIIVAVVCFPCGLFALLCDQEKRCVRCGARVGT